MADFLVYRGLSANDIIFTYEASVPISQKEKFADVNYEENKSKTGHE